MAITTISQRTTPTTEHREGQARHRGRTTDLRLQDRQREKRGRGARHRMEEYSARELRDNRRVDAAQHRACRGEDAVSA